MSSRRLSNLVNSRKNKKLTLEFISTSSTTSSSDSYFNEEQTLTGNHPFIQQLNEKRQKKLVRISSCISDLNNPENTNTDKSVTFTGQNVVTDTIDEYSSLESDSDYKIKSSSESDMSEHDRHEFTPIYRLRSKSTEWRPATKYNTIHSVPNGIEWKTQASIPTLRTKTISDNNDKKQIKIFSNVKKFYSKIKFKKTKNN